MIVEIQCLAFPPGTAENRYEHIEAAIEAVKRSGLSYEVGPLGTTFEGEPDEVWALLRAVHEACLASGADGLVSVVKLEQTRAADAAPTMRSLTAKHR
ncbi:MAG: MTH1187 family thiamine-binding protein [Acidimicrobiales bacterium]